MYQEYKKKSNVQNKIQPEETEGVTTFVCTYFQTSSEPALVECKIQQT